MAAVPEEVTRLPPLLLRRRGFAGSAGTRRASRNLDLRDLAPEDFIAGRETSRVRVCNHGFVETPGASQHSSPRKPLFALTKSWGGRSISERL